MDWLAEVMADLWDVRHASERAARGRAAGTHAARMDEAEVAAAAASSEDEGSISGASA